MHTLSKSEPRYESALNNLRKAWFLRSVFIYIVVVWRRNTETTKKKNLHHDGSHAVLSILVISYMNLNYLINYSSQKFEALMDTY